MKLHSFIAGLLTFVIVPALAAPAHAIFVDNGNFTTDTASGLDWLDVTETTGRSFNSVSADLAAGGSLDGWRYATATDLVGMLSNWSGTALTVNPGLTPLPDGTSTEIFGLLELTSDQSVIGDHLDFKTWGLIANSEGAGVHNVGEISFFWDLIAPNAPKIFTYATSLQTAFPDHGTEEIVGSFLIRGDNVSAIPLPTTIWVFGAGMIGLGYLARRRRLS